MPDDIVVDGLIQVRWSAWGSAQGAFGRPLSAEEDVPGTNGRRQRFERGEIAWSPDQDMVLSVFLLRNDARFDWSAPHDGYDYYRFNINHDDVGQGQADTQIPSDRTHIWARLQGFGEYAFTAKGCKEGGFLGHDECQEWAVPVRLEFRPVEDPPAPGIQAMAADFAMRWQELGASAGWLGKPTDPESTDANGVRIQHYDRGVIMTSPAHGPGAVIAGYQRGNSIELDWGGVSPGITAYAVSVHLNGVQLRNDRVEPGTFGIAWARPGAGSGRYVFGDPGPEGVYEFVVLPLPDDGEASAVMTPTIRVNYSWQGLPNDAALTKPAAGTGIAQALASHWARVSDIATHYAISRPLRPDPLTEVEAGEDQTLQMIAHLRAVHENAGFCVPGELPSRLLFAVFLRLLHAGQMGSSSDDIPLSHRDGDYDMAVKGLMTVLYRFGGVLNRDDEDFILDQLTPPQLAGRHDPSIEFFELTEAGLVFPETENHILMIETSRYLVNQVRFERTADPKYDNNGNGLTGWLLMYLQRLAKFDFLEFNARPYQRASLHAILNLHDFAKDEPIRTAAQIVLDFMAVKFAVSSNRLRRIGPYRRRPDKQLAAGDPLLPNANGDQLTGFALMWTGPTQLDGTPSVWFPRGFEFHALIVGLSSYRPPTAAYLLAGSASPPTQHRFYHGRRPRPTFDQDDPDGGVEIYYRSPSFMLTAGGMFLNSGYGLDAWKDIHGGAQTARPQATTLVPTRLDLVFGDLIRFDRYPDDRNGTNTGVHQNFACGANLQIADRWLNRPSTVRSGPWIFLNLDVAEAGIGRLGFYVALYRTAAAGDGGPASLGLLHAVEAEGLDFAAYAEQTQAANQLPAAFDYDGIYVFHAADQQSFTFVFTADDKYAARVINWTGTGLPSLDSLPLAEGPWIAAPGGHDGLLEIRYPGSPSPLVLDFRDGAHPLRTDGSLHDDQSLVDRADALIAFATGFMDDSRTFATFHHDAEAARSSLLGVETMRSFEPPASAAARYLSLRGFTLMDLIFRLTTAGRPAETGDLGTEAIAVYRRSTAVATPADLFTQASFLLTLSIYMSNAEQLSVAVDAAVAAADVLRAGTPEPGHEAEYLKLFGDALITVVIRLQAADRGQEGGPAGREAVDVYRRAAAAPGAKVTDIADSLTALATWLTRAGRPEEAALATQASTDIRPA